MGPSFFRFPGGNNVVSLDTFIPTAGISLTRCTGGMELSLKFSLVVDSSKRVKPRPLGGNGTQLLDLSWTDLDVRVTGDTSTPSMLSTFSNIGDFIHVLHSGLGLLEYLEFFEDTNMEPIMAVWSGYALGGTSIAESGLAPYIQQAKDQVCLSTKL